MEFISLDGKVNFFEKRNEAYRQALVGNNKNQNTFSLDDKF